MLNIMRAIMRRHQNELGAKPISNDDSRLAQSTRKRLAVGYLHLGPACLDDIRRHLMCTPIQAWAAMRDLETIGKVYTDEGGRYALRSNQAAS